MTSDKSTTKAKSKPPKALNRPSANSFREAAARLDLINSMVPRRRLPVLRDLSSDEEQPEGEPRRRQRQRHERSQAVSPCERRRETRQQQSQPSGPARRRYRPIINDSEDEEYPDPSGRWSAARNRQRSTTIDYPSTPLAHNQSTSSKQQSSIFYNASSFTDATPPGRPIATSRTGSIAHISGDFLHTQSPPYRDHATWYMSSDNSIPTLSHPIRDEQHMIHKGYDVAIPSVEGDSESEQSLLLSPYKQKKI